MREVYVNQDHARVGFYKSLLDEEGIPNFVRNDFANNITSMPSPLFFPALCVVNDDDYDDAMLILKKVNFDQASQSQDWTCSNCGELVPGSFDSCWQCGNLRVEP